MATGMVDLSSLQQVNFGNGVTGSYDPSSGTYYDSGGNPLSASDLAAYGSFTVSSPGSTPSPAAAATPSPTPVNPSGNGGSLSGLSGLFSSIGGSIVAATRPPTVTTPQGTLVYNPATGGYVSQASPAIAGAGVSTLTPIILLLIAAGLVFAIMQHEG
jgi:hypothetical protein